MPYAVILDMDGLLLDTEPTSLDAWRDAASQCGYELDDEVCERMIGQGIVTNRAMLIAHFGAAFPMSRVEALAQERYRLLLEARGVAHKPGLVEFLQFLDDRGIPRAVATSTATEFATELLRRAGLLDRLDAVVGGDQVSRGKPEPDIFLAAAARVNRAPAECIVLEDSAPGIRAAVAAGMTAILIPDGREPTDETRQAAFAVVDSLLAAREVVGRCCGICDL